MKKLLSLLLFVVSVANAQTYEKTTIPPTIVPTTHLSGDTKFMVCVSAVSITSGTASLAITVASCKQQPGQTAPTFTSADIGKRIVITGAGTSNATLATAISGVSAGATTTLTLADNAGATLASNTAFIAWGTYSANVSDDATAINAAITASEIYGGKVVLPKRVYGVGSPILLPSSGTFDFDLNGSIIVPIANLPGTITAKIDNGSGGAGNTLTVTAFGAGTGPIEVGQSITVPGGSNVTVTAFVSGGGDAGTYTVNGGAQNITSEAMTTNGGDLFQVQTPTYFTGSQGLRVHGGGVLDCLGLCGYDLELASKTTFIDHLELRGALQANLVCSNYCTGNDMSSLDMNNIVAGTPGNYSASLYPLYCVHFMNPTGPGVTSDNHLEHINCLGFQTNGFNFEAGTGILHGEDLHAYYNVGTGTSFFSLNASGIWLGLYVDNLGQTTGQNCLSSCTGQVGIDALKGKTTIIGGDIHASEANSQTAGVRVATNAAQIYIAGLVCNGAGWPVAGITGTGLPGILIGGSGLINAAASLGNNPGCPASIPGAAAVLKGLPLNGVANVNDATASGGTVASIGAVTFPAPTFTADNATIYTHMANMVLPAPVASTNATATYLDSLYAQGGIGTAGLIEPTATLGIVGTTGADQPAAGSIGQVVSLHCQVGTQAAAATAVTVTIAAPGVVTWSSHTFAPSSGLANYTCPINFTGTPPTGLTVGTTYYIIGSSVSGDTFQVADTAAHALAGTNAVTTTGSDGGTTAYIGVLATTGGVYSGAAFKLIAGDWDCTNLQEVQELTSLTTTRFASGVDTSLVITSIGQFTDLRTAATIIGANNEYVPSPVVRENVSAATTSVFGIVVASFSAGTMNEGAFLRCRRMR